MTKLELDKCKGGCGRIKKHSVWIFMSEYQKALIVKYYDVSFRLSFLCEDCRQKILNGIPIK